MIMTSIHTNVIKAMLAIYINSINGIGATSAYVLAMTTDTKMKARIMFLVICHSLGA